MSDRIRIAVTKNDKGEFVRTLQVDNRPVAELNKVEVIELCISASSSLRWD